MTLGLFTCLNPGISLSKSAHRGAALSRSSAPSSASSARRRGERGCLDPPDGRLRGAAARSLPLLGAPSGQGGGHGPHKRPRPGKERKGRGAARERRPPHRFCSGVPLRPEGAAPDPTAKGPEGSSALLGTTGREVFAPRWEAAPGTSGHRPPRCNTPLPTVPTWEHAGRLDAALSEGLAFPAEVCDGTRVVLT